MVSTNISSDKQRFGQTGVRTNRGLDKQRFGQTEVQTNIDLDTQSSKNFFLENWHYYILLFIVGQVDFEIGP